jgi:hypothetical protein
VIWVGSKSNYFFWRGLDRGQVTAAQGEFGLKIKWDGGEIEEEMYRSDRFKLELSALSLLASHQNSI